MLSKLFSLFKKKEAESAKAKGYNVNNNITYKITGFLARRVKECLPAIFKEQFGMSVIIVM